MFERFFICVGYVCHAQSISLQPLGATNKKKKKMRSTRVTIVIILFIFHRAAFDEGDKYCTDPWGEMGTCQNVTMCNALMKPLYQGVEEARDWVRRSVCDFTNSISINCCPIVCCPLINHDKRKYNGGNHDNDNEDDTKKKPHSPYVHFQQAMCDLMYDPVNGRVNSKETDVFVGAAALGYLGATTPNTIDWMCGGSLITTRHVLTAAHCVYRRPSLFLVRVGDHDLESDDDKAYPIDILIEKRNIHPQFDIRAFVNDIAVLRLQDDIQFTDFIRPICLPVSAALRKANLVGKYPTAVGWGSIYYGGPRSAYTQMVQLPIVPEEQCKNAYRTLNENVTIDERVLCAGGIEGRSLCTGDSGGPLVLSTVNTPYVVGVDSYGYKCGERGYPGVFTRVSSFLDFIESQLN